MISAGRFVYGQSLSETNQPYVGNLFEDFHDSTLDITFVIGAGVSVDASLPTWPRLIENITAQLTDEAMRKLADLDDGDLMRRADYLIPMAKAANRDDIGVVHAALYQSGGGVGKLGRIIAKLGVSLRSRARFVTTNFDDVLEDALVEQLAGTSVEPRSYGLRTVSKWKAAVASAPFSAVEVLHVHGMIPRHTNRPRIEPVILAESYFLKHGHDVRKIIVEQLKTSCVVFVGVSLSDPNLIGPLWDTRSKNGGGHVRRSTPYVLQVPPPPSEDTTPIQNGKFAVAKAQYFDDTLETRPILLKSYSQLFQLLTELTFAISKPSEYRAIDSKNTIVKYTNRFDSVMNKCYSALGCDLKTDIPEGDLAISIMNRLQACLGPGSALRKKIDLLNNNVGASDPTEHFGLFLWLRARQRGDNSRPNPPYKLNLVGTSTYAHHEAWSIDRRVDVNPNSSFPPAKALYLAQDQLANIPPEVSPNGLWKGMLAVPISVHSRVDELDSVLVGVIALNTTHYPMPQNLSKRHLKAGQKFTSVLSKIDETELRQTSSLLKKIADEVLGGAPATLSP